MTACEPSMHDIPRTIAWIGGTDGFVRLHRSDAAADAAGIPRLPDRRGNLGSDPRRCACAARRPSASRRPWASSSACSNCRTAARRLRKAPAARSPTYLRTSRPTAVNLFWALDRMERTCRPHLDELPPTELHAHAARRSPGHRGGRSPHVPGHRRGRRRADRRRAGRADALQRRRPGDGGLRHRPGRHVHRRRAGQGAFTSSPTRPGRCCKGPG